MGRYPVPLWVKVFFVTLAGVFIASMTLGGRFFGAYLELKRANAALDRRNFADATRHFDEAARRVPESKSASVAATYDCFAGLQAQQPEIARQRGADIFEHSLKGVRIAALSSQADWAIASSAEDWVAMAARAEAQLASDRGAATAHLALAFALSCSFQADGSETYRRRAVNELLVARKHSGQSDPAVRRHIEQRLEAPPSRFAEVTE